MSKIMQNLVVLMEPSEDAFGDSLKAGNMILNRFCIDEDAAFELSGVNYLKKSSLELTKLDSNLKINREFEAERKIKGKDYLFPRPETVLLDINYIIYNY